MNNKVVGFSKIIVPEDYLQLDEVQRKELLQAVFSRIYRIMKNQTGKNYDTIQLMIDIIDVTLPQYEQEQEYEVCCFYRDLRSLIQERIINRVQNVVDEPES